MGSVNKVIILGNLGQDPEVRMTQSGQQVATVNVATSESFTTRDGRREDRTEWHRVVLWGKLAELAGKYLKKGRRIFIEGRLQTRSWDDQNGQKRYTTEIVGTQMVFVDSARNDGPSDSNQADVGPYYGASQQPETPSYDSGARSAPSLDLPEDDVPF